MDTETTVENPAPFMIKTLSKLETEGNYLSLIKSIYKKPKTSIILNGEQLYALLLGNEVWKFILTTHIHQSTGSSSQCN